MRQFRDVNLAYVDVLLCDADGNLFPSEEPAFVASADVTNRFLRDHGVERQFTPTELRLTTTGKNFRSTIVDLAVMCGVPIAPDLAARYPGLPHRTEVLDNTRTILSAAEVEQWVAEEKRAVSAYLRDALSPDPAVITPLTQLSWQFGLAAVSSSALSRLDACFEATDLAPFFSPDRRFSAEDSLPAPTSKPDPAIYTFAGSRLGIRSDQGLAIEDSVPGAQSAVAAGFQTVGNVAFVPPSERAERIAALEAVGVVGVISSWAELVELVGEAKRTVSIDARSGT